MEAQSFPVVRNGFGLVSVVCLVIASTGCQSPERSSGARGSESPAAPVGSLLRIEAPLGLPPVPVPPDNPLTAETIELGRKLFQDTRLSVNNTVSCSSCHNERRGFSDGLKTSVGVDGKKGTRNAPTVLNSAYASLQFWDGRAASLEDQAAGPMANPLEMNQAHDVSVGKLQADPFYKADFQKAFGPGPITIEMVKKALAAFERTLVSGNSPFDRYRFGGDKSAMSAAAIRGMVVFMDPRKGNCVTCHTVDEKHALFFDGKFHNLGVGVNSDGELPDLGRFEQSRINAEKGAFKTPTLRNVAQSAPYMHDGSLKTLKDVVDFYAGGGNSNDHLDPQIKPLHLSAQDRSDLVAFLESLTGETPAKAQLASSR